MRRCPDKAKFSSGEHQLGLYFSNDESISRQAVFIKVDGIPEYGSEIPCIDQIL
jgi:hypothetical protein